MQRKKRNTLIAVLAVILVATAAAGGTLAYMTDSSSKTNTFTVGKLDIKLEEPNYNCPEPVENAPGDMYDKDPTVIAVEGNSYMRLVLKFTTMDGKEITDAARIAKIWQTIYHDPLKKITKGMTLAQLTGKDHYNTTDFDKAAGKEVYSYKKEFKKGDTVKLFTTVIIPSDWNQKDLEVLGDFKIVIKVEAIQSKGFANAAAAFAALDAAIAGGKSLDDYGQK